MKPGNTKPIGADIVPAAKTSETRRDRVRWRLWTPILYGMTLLVLATLAVLYHFQRRAEQRNSIIADVQSARGTVSTPPSILDLGEQFLRRDFRSYRDNGVRLMDPALRGSWMRDHGNLAQLQITEIDLRGTREFDAADAGLFADNPIAIVHVPLARNADHVAAALTDSATLTAFDARGSDLTDDGLGLLPLEQLQRLEVQNSTISAKGLHRLQRCRQLDYLAIDGNQLDAELVKTLKTVRTLKTLRLVGRKVTDELLLMTAGLNLSRIELDRTSVTSDGIAQHSSRQPDTAVVDF